MSEPYSTPAEIDALAEPHPLYAKIIQAKAEGKLPDPDMFQKPVLDFVRDMRKKATDATYGSAPEGVVEEVVTIKMRDGHDSETRVFKPANLPAGGAPLVMLNFGGGFIGEARQLAPYARGLVRLYGVVVAAISYRLGPENTFPTAHNDGWDNFLWLGSNAASLGADPSKGFIVGGVSAGGNLSAVIAQNAVEQKINPPITGLWLCVPMVFPDASFVPEEFLPKNEADRAVKALYRARATPVIADGPMLPVKAIEAMRHHYAPDYSSQWYTPIHAKDAHKGMPTAYIEVNGMDPLRDDGIIYEKLLRRNGTKTKLTVWPGLPHAHFALMQEPEHMPVRKAAARDTMKGFAWLLGKEAPEDSVINELVDVPQAG